MPSRSQRPATTQESLTDRVFVRVMLRLTMQKITRKELARRMNLSSWALRRRLNGHPGFTTDELDRLAAALGCTVVDLIAEPNGHKEAP
jgi:DNA-binding Xre family transcriptional regulator